MPEYQHQEPVFVDDVQVKLIDYMAKDISVTRSAQVSVKGENNPGTDTPRLINYLSSARHGSPFEHTAFTFFVKAPIFVFREFMRHRMASYNEQSARYSIMAPEFYIPGVDRGLVNVGTPAKPDLQPGTEAQREVMDNEHRQSCVRSWEAYERMLGVGIAREVARGVLPVNLMSQMYVTINARSLMNFLSLRVDGGESAVYPSWPQKEIEMVAERMEALFAEKMPNVHAAFVASGRVAP